MDKRPVVKYGMVDLGDDFSDNGQPVKVIDFIKEDLEVDNMCFSNSLYQRIYEEALQYRTTLWENDFAVCVEQAEMHRRDALAEGRAKLQQTAATMEEINIGEKKLADRCDGAYEDEIREFAQNYLEKSLASHPDDDIRSTVTDLVVEKHKLSKIYFKNTKVETEVDRLDDLVPRALLALKYDMARCFCDDLRKQILSLQNAPGGYDLQEVFSLMSQQKKWQEFYGVLASRIGERVYEPLR